MSKPAVIFTIIVILLASNSYGLSHAQSSILISEDNIDSDYPYGLFIDLTASSTTKIEHIKLLYRTNGVTCQSSLGQQVMDFNPATTVEVEWYWDFSQSGILPPGTEVYWQWQITDADSHITLTDEQTYQVTDTRHDWNKLTGGQVTLQWYMGSSSFGQELLNTATRTLQRIASDAGVHPSGQIWLTIYPSVDEILEVDPFVSEWAGGVAYPEYNSSIMAIFPLDFEWANQIIPHELAHLVTEAHTFNCLGTWTPTWLGEGLAVYAEGDTTQYDHDMVINALENNSLPPLRTLEAGFSSNSGSASLSYAQSGMVVTYMLNQYGSQKMSDLLNAIKTGNKIDKALTIVYNKRTDDIDAEWRVSLGYQPQPTLIPTSAAHTSVPTLALWTSSVKPTPSATLPFTPTFTIIPPTQTLQPVVSPTLPESDLEQTLTDPVNSSEVIPVYIVGLALVGFIFLIIIVIVLVLTTRNRRSNS